MSTTGISLKLRNSKRRTVRHGCFNVDRNGKEAP
jgi:hypothetical protein